MTGSTLDRPALRRVLLEARAGRFNLLLVYRVDRLSRSVRGLAQILEELDQAGVMFRSATEPFDTGTPAGRMMVQMLGVFAEFERATLVDRVVAGMERKAARGGWCGARPYGYQIDAATGFLAVKAHEAALVPVIFDLYLNKRLGAHSIASWLSERGYRTKDTRPWSHMSVLVILRNRAYRGEVSFRGARHAAPHHPLIDAAMFEAVQQLLAERGENYSKRATNSSDYLLAGLVICEACGKRFIGTAAHGNRYRYKYYTCFSRHRYGVHACQADRLPADELDAAVLDALMIAYEDQDLISQAIQEAYARAQAARPRCAEQLASVEAEIRKTDETLERYLVAFETGIMPEALCGNRVKAVGRKLAELRSRKAELEAATAFEQPSTPTESGLAEIRASIRSAIQDGPAPQRKALVQALVAEVRVQGREAIQPVFRVPDGQVRPLVGLVGATGVEPVTSSLSWKRSYQLSYAPWTHRLYRRT